MMKLAKAGSFRPNARRVPSGRGDHAPGADHIEYWPTQMLFGRRGKLREVIIGDSQDATVDAAVSALLSESV